MDESEKDLRVVPELYFLIAKFLSGGPLKETAQTLLRELQTVEVLPRRLDWEGGEHAQSYEELADRFSDIPWDRLAAVCKRALQLAPLAPPAQGEAPACPPAEQGLRARLSLLSDALVRRNPKYSAWKQDHSLVRRVAHRELGSGAATAAGGCGGRALFSPRMLAGLQLQRRTLGHLSAVYCLVFDCTGRYVVTGADDLLVKVWCARSGRLLGTLRGAGAEITDVCVSADGALLAAGSVERLVRVWSLVSGAPTAVLHAHAGTITSVHWAPPYRSDVRWLASTSTDGSVAFWTCSHDGQFLSQPVQYVERMRPGVCHMICAAWSAGGAFLACGSADHHVRVYTLPPHAQPPRRVLEVAVHCDAVDSISWAHSGLRFVSGSKDGCAALWTLHATQWRHQLLRCASADDKKLKVTMVCWDCSDQFVMTAVSDCTVRVWCARSGTQVRALHGHRDEAYVLEAHPFLQGVLLSAGHDGQLFVWDAMHGEVLAKFHNVIEGQGDGALFDAKWGGGASVAASDSHGHLLLLGLGAGHPLLRQLPQELFFHTDYRPLVRDALGGALDEQTETPPHEMPPPFLVDVEGAPHAPRYQRLVPGREHLAESQLVPAADRSRIDLMIEALAAERTPPGALAALGLPGEGARGVGVWRGEGVRHTGGAWHSGGSPTPACTRPILQPLSKAEADHQHRAAAELNEMEQAWWRREMRRRPLMISTGGTGGAGPERSGARRRPGRRPARREERPRARPVPRVVAASPEPEAEPEAEAESDSSTSDESVRLSAWDRTPGSASTSHSECSISYSGGSKSDESSESSQYSDWEAGQPPARARRKPVPTARYSPSTTTPKRPPAAAPAPPPAAAPAPAPAPAGAGPSSARLLELQEAYRPGEWLTCVSPRKAPYHPQMADHVVYFRLGHQRYFEAVSEKDLYKVSPRDKPWERTHVNECEFAKVVGIKYAIKPPRIACLRLSCESGTGDRARTFTVKYHDMPDVIDFIVPRQQYDAAVARRWGPGDRFRCMIDDSWWTGVVLERTSRDGDGEAASHFLSLQVRWDNGEVERLSPWDLEPIDPNRLPSEPGGSVPVLAHELEAVLHKPHAADWPPHGDRAAACEAISAHIAQVMSLSVAEPFVAPVDLQAYPAYAMVVAYPVDLATIKARIDNMFYRRAAAAQFDVRYLASNAELFNEPHSPIVRQARLVSELLLAAVADWRNLDVVATYHHLAATYHSSDDDGAQDKPRGGGRGGGGGSRPWRRACAELLSELIASADAEPFRQPVSVEQAPDYHAIVSQPMDLGTVQRRLAGEQYASGEQFAADVRRVFANSRLYNTNKRSRIYSMTVRLSALFESLWSRRAPARPQRPQRSQRPRQRPRPPRRAARSRPAPHNRPHEFRNGHLPAPLGAHTDSSDSETLAATSRRVHAAPATPATPTSPPARARARADSWDSDAPLTLHTKGKGVGKKSKASHPAPGTSTELDTPMVEEYLEEEEVEEEEGQESRVNGHASESDSDASDRVRPTTNHYGYAPTHQSSRKRRRRRTATSDDSDRSSGRRTKRLVRMPRERVTDGSSTSSSSSSDEGGAASASGTARRYESDHSYRARCSSDDDKPLTTFRQRMAPSGEAGPSGAQRTHNGHAPRRAASLRARHTPRRYNEDSEDDAVAAISKRQPHHHRRHLATHAAGVAARLHHRQALVSTSHASDHNYFNGHAPHPPSHQPQPHPTTGAAYSAEPLEEEEPPLSISSRGRVRKLTAKARGLLRE